jgi:hypothetical protein
MGAVAVMLTTAFFVGERVRPAADAAPASNGALAAGAFPRPESITVRLRSGGDARAVRSYAEGLGYAVADAADDPPALQLAIPDGVTLSRAVTDFTAKAGVLYAEPAYPLRPADAPVDPLYAESQRTYFEKMRAPEAWDISTGIGVIVAVLDTGLDVNHPDLAGRVWTNSGETPGNGLDDDGSGCIDDVHGCAFLGAPNDGCAQSVNGDIADDLGHGTFVAGIIAAAGNELGIVGTARNAIVLPIKILDCTGNGNTFSLGQGIVYGAARGARVLNVSLGGPIDSEYVREAIRIARDDYGALVVAASGNNGDEVAFPARYDSVLAVGATGSSGDQRAGFSTAGVEVDVVAIGVDIVSTVPESACTGFFTCLDGSSGYAIGGGTSFAAPIVSGLAALLISRNPYLRPEAIHNLIKSTADPMPASDRPDWAGSGRINMLRALQLPYRLGAPGTARN